jgi:hypothetical protein
MWGRMDHAEVKIHASINTSNCVERHLKRTHASILLSSVFGPHATDDESSGHSINPMKRYHNQGFYIDDAGMGERACYGTRAVR